MTTLARKTNGDLVQPVVDHLKRSAGQAIEHFKQNPDEFAVAVTPMVMLLLATRRHKLNFAEAALISECAFWSGYFAVEFYQNWKTRPAGSQPRLRKVT